jgi:hypothetical protein
MYAEGECQSVGAASSIVKESGAQDPGVAPACGTALFPVLVVSFGGLMLNARH